MSRELGLPGEIAEIDGSYIPRMDIAQENLHPEQSPGNATSASKPLAPLGGCSIYRPSFPDNDIAALIHCSDAIESDDEDPLASVQQTSASTLKGSGQAFSLHSEATISSHPKSSFATNTLYSSDQSSSKLESSSTEERVLTCHYLGCTATFGRNAAEVFRHHMIAHPSERSELTATALETHNQRNMSNRLTTAYLEVARALKLQETSKAMGFTLPLHSYMPERYQVNQLGAVRSLFTHEHYGHSMPLMATHSETVAPYYGSASYRNIPSQSDQTNISQHGLEWIFLLPEEKDYVQRWESNVAFAKKYVGLLKTQDLGIGPDAEESTGHEHPHLMEDRDNQKVSNLANLLSRAHEMIERTTFTARGSHTAGEVSGHRPLHSSGSSSQATSSGARNLTKRRRNSDDDSGDRGSSNGKQKKVSQESDNQDAQKSLACPFFKHDPLQHSSPPCSGPNGWPSVARLKEHLIRKHQLPIHCTRCRSTFQTKELLEEHLHLPMPCLLNSAIPFSGMTEAQTNALKSKKAMFAFRKDEEAKWKFVYSILFPETPLDCIPSPYYDSISTSDGAMSPYQAYLRRELPPKICRLYASRYENFDEAMAKTLLADGMQSVTQEYHNTQRLSAISFAQASISNTSSSAQVSGEDIIGNILAEQDWQSSLDPHQDTPQTSDRTGSNVRVGNEEDGRDLSLFPKFLDPAHDTASDIDDWFNQYPKSFWNIDLIEPAEPILYNQSDKFHPDHLEQIAAGLQEEIMTTSAFQSDNREEHFQEYFPERNMGKGKGRA